MSLEMKKAADRNRNDKTALLEEQIRERELKPSFRDYPRLMEFVLSNVFIMSSILLILTVIRPLLSPATAFLWKQFIDGVYVLNGAGKIGLEIVLLLCGFGLVKYVQGILHNMTTLNGEQAFLLDVVQKNRFSEFILTKMYGKVSRLPAEYYESSDFYDRTARAFSYAGEQMRREVVVNVYAVFAGIIGAIAIFAALYSYHPMLSIVAVISPLPTLYSQLIGSKITHKFHRDTSQDRRKLEYYEELTRRTAVKELKVFNAGKFILKKWETVATGYLRQEIRTRYRTEAIGLIALVINNAVSVGSAVLAVWLLTRGELSLGAVGAVFALSVELNSIAGSIFSGIGKLISNRRDVSQLFEFLDLDEERACGADLPLEFTRLRAEGIRYRYPMTDSYVLDGVDFSIDRGEIIAFVGENGAGKSTFVKILLGLLQATEGEVWYNDAKSGESPVAQYHDRFGAVFQDFVQYRGLTIGDNVRLGDFDAERSASASIESVGFASHPIDTILGRELDGVELSGGEWQKLAIARGLYRNRNILVLDEPTASLDPLAEEEVFKRFLAMAEGKTSIIVTHRIGSAALANRILVFSAGRIIEEGSHAELLELNGMYAAMFAAQAQWYAR